MATGTWSSEKGGHYVRVSVVIKPKRKKPKAKKKPRKKSKG